MKKLLKLVFLLTFLSTACAKDKALSKSEALALLQQMDIDKTMQVEKQIQTGQVVFTNSGSSANEVNYLNKLKADGIIQFDSVSSETQTFGSGRTEVRTTYNIAIKPQYQQFIVKQQGDIAVVQILYRDTKAVNTITMINKKQALVNVQFEKMKTPFYDVSLDKTLLKSRNGIYSHDVKFRKSNKNGWQHDWLDSSGI